MTQTTKKSKSQKVVKVLLRYFIKSTGAVVYKVQASNGVDTYCTTIVRGKATGCTCPSHTKCYHMTQLQQREQERTERTAQEAEKANEQKLADFRNAYDIIGPTKVTSDKQADYCDCCGRECHGGICGKCLA